jgi:putative Holliday junction resolvase
VEVKEYLGLDVGNARTGIARGSSVAKIAEPLQTVPTNDVVEMLTKLAQDKPLAAIVVGLPRSLDGNETDQTKIVRQWVKDAQSQTSLPFYWQDEALTTELATKGTKAGVDAEAAALMLQDFLNTPEESWVAC